MHHSNCFYTKYLPVTSSSASTRRSIFVTNVIAIRRDKLLSRLWSLFTFIETVMRPTIYVCWRFFHQFFRIFGFCSFALVNVTSLLSLFLPFDLVASFIATFRLQTKMFNRLFTSHSPDCTYGSSAVRSSCS